MKKLALLFSHPDVTLWARLLPWGHFVIFPYENGSPADTLSQDWENLHKLRATGGPLQSASAHTELPHGLCLVTDVCTCVCPAHSTWLWAWQMPSCYVARAWGCVAISPNYSQSWDLPLLAQGSPKHVWEVSWVCGCWQQGKGGFPELLWLWCLWSKNRIQKIQLDVCPFPESNSPIFAPQSLHLAQHPHVWWPPARPSHQKTSPPHRIWKHFISTLVRKSIFIDCQSCLKEKGENIIKPGSTVSSSKKRN